MPIPNILERQLVQICVYWGPVFDTNGNSVTDNNGQVLFNAPIQLKCRWEEERKIITDKNGNEQVSNINVRVGQDVDELGILWLGLLVNINPSQKPFDNSDAWEIRKFEKIPNRRGYDFLRIAYL